MTNETNVTIRLRKQERLESSEKGR